MGRRRPRSPGAPTVLSPDQVTLVAPRAGASREPWPEAADGAPGGSQAPRRPPRAALLLRPAPTSRPRGLGAQRSRVLADLAPAASERGGASPQTVGGSGGLSWPRGCPRTPRASLGVTGGGDSDFGKVTGFLASGNHFQIFAIFRMPLPSPKSESCPGVSACILSSVGSYGIGIPC